MKNHIKFLFIISLFALIMGCGNGGEVAPPVNPPPPLPEDVIVSVEFTGPHAAQAREALLRIAQSDTTMSVAVDLRNADERNNYNLNERTEHQRTDDGIITIGNLCPGPFCMWLNWDTTDWHWAGTTDLNLGHNVVYLSTFDYPEYTSYEVMNRLFDRNQAYAFERISYSRFEYICENEPEPEDAYKEVLDEANISVNVPRVDFNFNGDPYTANSPVCNNFDDEYERGEYLQHTAKYYKEGDPCDVELEWRIYDNEGDFVDSGSIDEHLGNGTIRDEVIIDPEYADYPPGNYTVDYDATARDENGDIVDQSSTVSDLTVVLPRP